MANKNNQELSISQSETLLNILKDRFQKNMKRHNDMEWLKVEEKIKSNPINCWKLHQMEETGGEPDVVDFDKTSGEYTFFDCAEESPKGRRSICYDTKALELRKENKPKDSALNMAKNMGIEILSEEQYRYLQKLGKFDSKTSSWIKTPATIRSLGGAIFADNRYNYVFIYHNGAESYYAARAFRGFLKI